MRTEALLTLLGLYILMSAVSFCAYAIDKRKAIKDKRRIPENTLLAIDLAFGFPGGFIAQRTLRHKTAKLSYQVKYWGVAIVHLGAWAAAAYMLLTQTP